jgi:hypothetical protein
MVGKVKTSLVASAAFLLVGLPSLVLLLLGAGKPAPKPLSLPRPVIRPGGQVHGYVYVVGPSVVLFTGPKQNLNAPGGEPFPYIRLPNARVSLKALPAKTAVAGSVATSNMHGFFIIPKQPAGRYQLCVEATGYVSNCDPKILSIANGTLVLDHDVAITPQRGFLRGSVLLKDGQFCYQENQFFKTLVTTKVALQGAGGKVVAGPVSANSMGLYVLPNIAPGTYTVKALCAGSSASRDVSVNAAYLTGAAPVDLTFANAPPQIAFVVPTVGGKAVRKASPGDTVKVEVKVKDPNGDPLHYKWGDGSAGFVSTDSPIINWKLPAVAGYHGLNVEVSDGKGGFIRGHVVVAAGIKGEFFNGIVTDRQSHAPIAGAGVSINGKLVTTGKNGAFAATLPDADRYVVNVRSPQYALQAQIFYVGTTGMNLQLDRAQRTACSYQTGCVAIEQRRTSSRISFNPRDLVDSRGNPAQANVLVDVHSYDLRQANALPGDYGAIMANGRAATMESFGAVDVEITDAAGNRYELAPGKTAHLTIGVDPDELAHAPATIPLFSYDEKSGYWKEEGVANLAGNAYQANVSHLTAWNADSVFSGTACIAIHVQDQDPTHFAPPFPFRLHGDIPSSPGLFRHPDFTVTSQPFALYRLPPNVPVTIEVHTNSGPDFPTPPTFTVSSGAAIDPLYEASPFNGVPPLYALNTACQGQLHIVLPLPTHDAPWLNVPSAPCDITTAGCDSETTEYYKAVGALDASGIATASRGTFNTWKTTNHLSTDPTTPAAGEVEAIFYNNGDLQFGRDMHCKQNGLDVACYVSNYSSTGLPAGPDQDAIHLAEANPRHPLASVAMEYNHSLGANAVRFYVYRADLPGNDGTLFKNPALDSEGGKYAPWLCMACHGGAYVGHNVENAAFLPFDVPTFKQDLILASPFSEPNQREAFGALNALVAATNPNNTNPNNPIGHLITQWYQWCGGPGAGGCTIDDVGHPYVPPPPAPGWSGPGQTDLYKTIPRVYCRTCHMAQGSSSSTYPDWTQYDDFNDPGFLKFVACTARSMPHAEVPFKAFWLSTDPHGPAYLGAPSPTGIGIAGGCPP